MTADYFEVSLRVVVEVTDAVELMASASFQRTASDSTCIHIASTAEEALVDRFALLEALYRPAHGMRVWEHSERVNPLTDRTPYLDARWECRNGEPPTGTAGTSVFQTHPYVDGELG
jgi:hypothetical protein